MSFIVTISLNSERLEKLKDKKIDVFDDAQVKKYIFEVLDAHLGLKNAETKSPSNKDPFAF